MTRPEGPTPELPERLRMPLRIASVFAGYLIYLVLGKPLVGALLVCIGFVAFDWAVIEKLTTYRKDRLSMMLAGQTLLGIGLMIAGAVVLFR